MKIDINAIGYRWRGIYSQYLSYLERDVVYQNGGAYVIRSGVPVAFALGQQDAILKGALLTGGVSVGGSWGMVLHANANGTVEFRFMGDRNSIIATSLMNTFGSGGSATSRQYMMAVMSDGVARGWGRSASGQLGVGRADDWGQTFPRRVPFPPGTPRIVSIKSSWSETYFIDATGGLWHTGENASSASGTNTQNNIPKKLNGLGDLGSSAVVVKVFSSHDFFNNRKQGCIDSNGLVYMWGVNSNGLGGWGNTSNSVTPKVVPISTRYPMRDAFVTANLSSASYLIDTFGRMWVAGEFNANGTGAELYDHRLFAPWGESNGVKTVTVCASDDDDSLALENYRAYAVVLTNGELYMWGHDGIATGGRWGIGVTGDIWPGTAGPLGRGSPIKCLDGVADAYSFAGQQGRTVALMQDGTVKRTGTAGLAAAGETAGTNSWQTVGGSLLTGVKKLRAVGGGSATAVMALRSDGRAVSWGYGAAGNNGSGNVGDADAISLVALDKTIVDFQTTGELYFRDSTVNSLSNFFLTSDGGVYGTGYAGYGLMSDVHDLQRNTPSNIFF